MSKKTEPATTFRTMIGGQALLEGILMRGPSKQAIVCRTGDGLVEKVEELKLVKDRHPILGWPFIRGVVNFLDSMVKGVQALTYSAEQVPDEQQAEPDKLDLWIERHFSSETAQKLIIGVAVVLGLGLALGLFIVLPAAITSFIPGLKGQYMLKNLIEGLLKLIIFFAYMALVSRMKEMRRVFSYHGAEHKAIFCYEKELPLTVENVRIQSRFHPRCGTSFMFVVIILSIFTGMLIQVDNVFLRIGCRLLLLPLVVGIGYEINRWVGRHDNLLSAILSWPGKKLQHLTTNEPDDSMIECAIRALELVIPEEKGKDSW